MKGFAASLARVAERLRRKRRFDFVRPAYLELSRPSIPEAVRDCVRGGASEIFVVPYFVLTGRHVRADIPRLVRAARREHGRRVRIHLCRYLGYDESLVRLVERRIREKGSYARA